jgi:hypothetical protein
MLRLRGLATAAAYLLRISYMSDNDRASPQNAKLAFFVRRWLEGRQSRRSVSRPIEALDSGDIIPERQAASLRSQQRWGIVDTCPCGRSAAAANESVEPLPFVLNVTRWDTMAHDPRSSNGLDAWACPSGLGDHKIQPQGRKVIREGVDHDQVGAV